MGVVIYILLSQKEHNSNNNRESTVVYKEQSLTAEDGLKLNVYRWLPEHPKAAVVLSHGWSEHAGRYEQVAKWFALHGYEVHALDHRGHGKSEGVRGHWG